MAARQYDDYLLQIKHSIPDHVDKHFSEWDSLCIYYCDIHSVTSAGLLRQSPSCKSVNELIQVFVKSTLSAVGWYLCHREVPRELIQQARGGEVNLNLEDHRHEDYVKPRTVVRAFAGEGHRLGWYAVHCSYKCCCALVYGVTTCLFTWNMWH